MDKKIVVDAAKLLNSIVFEDEEKDAKVPLISKKIKVTAVKEEDLIKDFLETCESIPETLEVHIPNAVSDVYNALVKEEKERKQAVTQAPPIETPKVSNGKPSDKKKTTGETIDLIASKVAEGIYTAKEIQESVVGTLGVKASTVATLISDGKNPKYSKFSKLIVVDKDGKLSFKK